MSAAIDKAHEISSLVVEVSPAEIDAGADMKLKARASSSPALDLRGQALEIRDENNNLAGMAELAEFDGETTETAEVAIKVPVKAGQYTWLAVLPARAQQGSSHVGSQASFSFTVKPHTMSLVVWDVPATVVVGERFKVKVGIKCSTDCVLENNEFTIVDQDGTTVATGTLGPPWPGTTALYSAEIELTAPDTEGLFKWEARIPGSDVGMPHNEGAASFSVRFVAAPDFTLTVEVYDIQKQTPINNAGIVMHPYRARTNAEGIARLSVRRGQYTIFVSGPKYIPIKTDVDVTGDMTTRAELMLEPVKEKN